MIKGLYSAASAMVSNLNRQTILSHNISNVDTPGFKTVLTSMQEWETTGVVSQQLLNQQSLFAPAIIQSSELYPLEYLGELGLGVENTEETLNFELGATQTTGNPLDFSIQGDGFFRVETPDGERLTRDGRFQRDTEGNLVTLQGYFVLSEDGTRINLSNENVEVSADGTISFNLETVGKLGIVAYESPETMLERESLNVYAVLDGAVEANPGTIQQKTLEMSNVNIAETMTQLITVGRAYEAAQQLVSVQDSLLGRAISSLGNI